MEPSAVGPSTSDQFNTIGINLIPIACWRVEDLRFDFDSSFVRPEVAAEVAHLASLMKQHKGSPISLFGHADPVGDDEYNKILSGRRAAAIYGLLTRDVELWDTLYTVPFSGDNWSNTKIADMLWFLGYPAEANNRIPPRPRRRSRLFKAIMGCLQAATRTNRPGRAFSEFIWTGLPVIRKAIRSFSQNRISWLAATTRTARAITRDAGSSARF